MVDQIQLQNAYDDGLRVGITSLITARLGECPAKTSSRLKHVRGSLLEKFTNDLSDLNAYQDVETWFDNNGVPHIFKPAPQVRFQIVSENVIDEYQTDENESGGKRQLTNEAFREEFRAGYQRGWLVRQLALTVHTRFGNASSKALEIIVEQPSDQLIKIEGKLNDFHSLAELEGWLNKQSVWKLRIQPWLYSVLGQTRLGYYAAKKSESTRLTSNL